MHPLTLIPFAPHAETSAQPQAGLVRIWRCKDVARPASARCNVTGLAAFYTNYPKP